MANIDDPSVGFIPLDEIAKPIDGVVYCHVDKWFLVHPERGVVCHIRRERGRQPVKKIMCNANEEVTRRIGALYWPWAEVKQLPLAFCPYTDF